MSTSHKRWLLGQLPQWEAEGLVTTEGARVLRERHALDASQPGLAQIVMGAIGALLIGTGLIAVIGYNWDEFTRPIRLVFAFLPLLTSQVISFIVLQKRDAAAVWVRETAALLQTLATGACIALVSQIYNLGGDWPDFLFWWFLLTLPLAWVFRSHSVALFYLIAIAIWSVNQVELGRPWHDSPLLYPLLLLGLLPYWPGWPVKRPMSNTVRWVMTVSATVGLGSTAAFVVKTCFHQEHSYFDAVVWLWTLMAAVFVLVPLNHAGVAESTGRKPQVVLGTLWLIGFGVAATFHEFADNIFIGVGLAIQMPLFWGVLGVLAVCAMLAAWFRRWAVVAIASLALVPWMVFALVAGSMDDPNSLLSTVVTIHLAAVGIALIMLDFMGKVGAPRLGAALLCIVIIARMADSHFSLLAKGLAFIAVGIAFLAFNFFMSRRRKSRVTALSSGTR